MTFANSDEITAAIKQVVSEIAPDMRYVPKYGGEVLAHLPDVDTKFVGGIFTYKDHVSLEFSAGALFDDPDGRLQGSGKKRRHLKFATVDDVAAQNIGPFLSQALAT